MNEPAIEGELIRVVQPAETYVYVARLLVGNPGRVEVFTSHTAAVTWVVNILGGPEIVRVTCMTWFTWFNREGWLVALVNKQRLHDHEDNPLLHDQYWPR